MEIHGRLVTADGPDQLPVAIISAGRKQIGVTVVVADFESGLTDNVEVVNASIALLARSANAHGLFGNFHKVELGTEAGAMSRIEMTLAVAEDGDTIAYLCANAGIFDIAWHALKVRKP